MRDTPPATATRRSAGGGVSMCRQADSRPPPAARGRECRADEHQRADRHGRPCRSVLPLPRRGYRRRGAITAGPLRSHKKRHCDVFTTAGRTSRGRGRRARKVTSAVRDSGRAHGDEPARGRGPGRCGSGPADARQIERRERVGAARFARRTTRSEQHAPDDTARDATPWRAPTSRICESGHRPGASGSSAPSPGRGTCHHCR